MLHCMESWMAQAQDSVQGKAVYSEKSRSREQKTLFSLFLRWSCGCSSFLLNGRLRHMGYRRYLATSGKA